MVRARWQWSYREQRSEYFCRTKGCVRITQREIDEITQGVMLDYLACPDVIDTLRAGEHHDDHELTTIRDHLATARTRHEEVADTVAAGTLSVTPVARSEPAKLAEITRLEQRERELATPNTLRGLIEPGTDVA